MKPRVEQATEPNAPHHEPPVTYRPFAVMSYELAIPPSHFVAPRPAPPVFSGIEPMFDHELVVDE